METCYVDNVIDNNFVTKKKTADDFWQAEMYTWFRTNFQNIFKNQSQYKLLKEIHL